MSPEKIHLNHRDVEYEFYLENTIDNFIQMLLEYKKRNFVYVEIVDDGGLAFYRMETEEQKMRD